MFRNSYDIDEKNSFNLNGSPRSFSRILAPLNSPKDTGVSPQYYENNNPFLRESNLRTTSERSLSSSSNVMEKLSNGAFSKTANIFNDTNSSQSKSLNAIHKAEEPGRFQLSEFIRYNSSMTNSQASLAPAPSITHGSDPYSKPILRSEDRLDLRIELHSSPNSKLKSYNDNPRLKEDTLFSKQDNKLIPSSVMLENSPYLLRSERPRTNSALNALSSMQSSPVNNRGQKNEFEIEKAFLTSEIELGNDGMIYQSLYGPVPEALMDRMRSAEANGGSTANNWVGGDKQRHRSSLNNGEIVERPRSSIWIHNETDEHIKEFMLEPDSLDIEANPQKSIPFSTQRKKAAKQVASKVPKISRKKPRKKGAAKKKPKVKKSPPARKTPKSNPKETTTNKPKGVKSRLLSSSDTNPIAESTTHIVAPSPGPILSSDDVKTNRDSDDEYIPGNYRQTRSKRKLTKVTQIDLDLEKKRRLGPRSKSGCWTCRVRHKACPEDRPICSQCKRLQLSCDYSETRPIYMTDPSLQAAKLKDIRNITSQQKKVSFAKRRAKN